MADTEDLKSSDESHEGSTPSAPTISFGKISDGSEYKFNISKYDLVGRSITLELNRVINLEPLNDRLIVERFTPEAKVGSLFIPDNVQDKPLYGKIVAISTESKLSQRELIGATIMFGKYAGMEVQHEGKTYLVVREEEIIAIVR